MKFNGITDFKSTVEVSEIRRTLPIPEIGFSEFGASGVGINSCGKAFIEYYKRIYYILLKNRETVGRKIF